MKHSTSPLTSTSGLVALFLLLLAALTFFYGRQHVKPFLPESFGRILFPPIATSVEIDGWQIVDPIELPETPTSILRAAQRWADDRGLQFTHCERLSSVSQWSQVCGTTARVDNDPDYAICLRYVRVRASDRDTENAMPGQWLPGRIFGEQSRQDFEAILARRPDFFYAAYLLGCWHRENGDTETASQYFEQAFAAAPVVLVMSFDLVELPESWEQNRPPRVTLVNNRTFAHTIDLTYHYGIDDCAMVRYPLLRADENGLVLVPAESDWLTWERTFYSGRRNAIAVDWPAVERPNQKFDVAWRFRGLSKVAMLQHDEMVIRPYDTNPMRTDPFFDPVWGTQQSLGVYEQVASYWEGQNEPSFLYERRILYPYRLSFPECASVYPMGKRTPTKHCADFSNSFGITFGQGQYLPPGDRQSPMPVGFELTESRTIRPIGGARLAQIDSRDPRLLTWFLQQTGMTRNALVAKIQTWHAEHDPEVEIALPHDSGLIMTVVDRDHAVWLIKLVPVPMSDTVMVTTLRVGSYTVAH